MSDQLPARVAPMLATPGPVPEGPGWAYEFKWDGVRAVTAVAGHRMRVQSRNDKPMLDIYPELAELGDLVDQSVVVDGEVVALDEKGPTRFRAPADPHATASPHRRASAVCAGRVLRVRPAAPRR